MYTQHDCGIFQDVDHMEQNVRKAFYKPQKEMNEL